MSRSNDGVLKARCAGLGLRPNGTTFEQLTALGVSQLARCGQAIRENNIKAA